MTPVASRAKEKQRRREERLRNEQLARERDRRTRVLRLGAVTAAALAALAVLAAIRPWEQDPPPPFAYVESGALERMARAGVQEDAGAPHIHPKLRVQVRGATVPVPANIGLGASHAPMHTHDPDGVMHVEGAANPTLAQFMALWGVPLDGRRLGPHRANNRERVIMWVKAPGATGFKEQPVRPALRLIDTQEVFLYYGPRAQAPIT